MKKILGKYFPLILFFTFSLTTIFLFEFGPIKYNVGNKFMLYFYLFCVHLAVFVGYIIGIKQKKIYSLRYYKVDSMLITFTPFVSLSLISSALLLVSFKFSFINWDPGLNRAILVNEKPGTLVSYLINYFSIFNFATIVLTIAFWSKLKSIYRIPAILVLISTVFLSIFTGSRHGLMQLFVGVITALLIASYAGRIHISLRKIGFIALGGVVAGFLYSSFIANVRHFNTHDYTALFISMHSANIDEHHTLLFIFPEKIRPGILQGYYYFTHGYEALSVALAKPFIGIGWGLGQSAAMVRRLADIFGNEAYLLSYFYRLYVENGYPLTGWVTSYPWIASDVTFPGSILVLLFFGYLQGLSWKVSILTKDPVAPILCCWMCYCFNQMPIMFIPQDIPTLLNFYGFMGIFMLTKRDVL